MTVAAAGADDVARLLAPPRTAATGAVVETTAGRIRGSTDRGVHIFKGVAYGASQPFRPMIPEIGDALTGAMDRGRKPVSAGAEAGALV